MNLRMRGAALVLLCAGWMSVAVAQVEPYRAGIVRITVPADDAPFDAVVYYPMNAEGLASQAEPSSAPANRRGAIANGRFPVVLIAHGGGPTGGSPLALSELSTSLARSGVLVLAPFHGKAGLRVRPTQTRLALDAVLADPRLGPHADADRLGMLGFSMGGAVTLELAGATPDFAHFQEYCRTHSDVMSCDRAPDRNRGDSSSPAHVPSTLQPSSSSPRRLPLKAIALLDPMAALFTREGLRAVTMPVLLFRPEQSRLPGDQNAVGLATALPRSPRYHVLPGGHFVFVDVCRPLAQAAAAEWCSDPPGVDRAAVHADLESTITKFFAENL